MALLASRLPAALDSSFLQWRIPPAATNQRPRILVNQLPRILHPPPHRGGSSTLLVNQRLWSSPTRILAPPTPPRASLAPRARAGQRTALAPLKITPSPRSWRRRDCVGRRRP
uniref:Uncharacterized protein n=1 Tax=Zea mays TaxID=4577 RepID=B4FI98_MAIZE|nr:unknown [Zea mays]ACN26277.1 unknown [Zea mays]ACN35226.1 unknown [Zea mays]|eukprot:NP_001132830.1 uncharacterized protein LOC100194320 [Zea mays]